jgi:SAM-dependent methyltransferase
MLPFVLPPLAPGAPVPQWTGHGFRLGDADTSVLEYGSDLRGWNDELTALHESAAGAGHPIDCASRDDALAQLREHVTGERPVLLEIGCSSGFMLRRLREAWPETQLLGADVVRQPLFDLARALPDVPLLRFDLVRCPLPDACLDAVVLLNVLEHIEDDAAAMRQVARILRPGGIAVIEVPAGPELYDAQDEALHHYRRYTADQLERLSRGAGLATVRRSHLGFFVYPAFRAAKRRSQRVATGNSGGAMAALEANIGTTSKSRLLGGALRLEQWLARHRVNYPTGIRCLLTARKPASR